MAQRIIFVCTGNTCRSPLAELAARERFGHLDVVFESAGLQGATGLPASPHSLRVAEDWGRGLRAHASRLLTPQLAGDATWLIGMTRSHGAILRSRFADLVACGIGVLGAPGLDLRTVQYSPAVQEIDDPYGESFARYQACGARIRDLVAGWSEVFEVLAQAKGAGR